MRSITRRVIAATAAVAVVAIGVTACSSGGSTSKSDSKSLTILTYSQAGTAVGDFYRAQFKKFTAKTGIKVNVDNGGDNVGTVFEASVAANKQADIVNINPVAAPLTWIDKGIAVPVTKYYDQWGLKGDLTPGALEEWTRSDGQLQGFPFEAYQFPVWYNMALFQKAGVDKVPTTTNELIADVAKLRAAGIQPFAVGGAGWTGQKTLVQIAQSYLDSKEIIKIYEKGGWCASNDAMKGLDLFVKLRDAGLFQDDSQGIQPADSTAAFLAGKAAIMAQGTWELSDLPASMAKDITFAGLPIPSGSTFSKPTGFQGTSNGFWISKKGADTRIDAIEKFIKYMYSPAVTAALENDVQSITAVKVDKNLLSKDLPQTLIDVSTTFPKSVEYAVYPDKYIPGAITNTFIQNTALAYGSGKSAQDICKALDSTYTS